MIHNLEPYPAYKDSGVPWLGEVPAHWETNKLRRVLTKATERNRPDLPLLSVVRERGVLLRDVTDMDENHNFIPDDLTNYKVVHHGQFAMNKMKAWQGSYGVSRHEGIVSPAYFVFDIRGVTGDYFHVAVRSKVYVPYFTQASDGVRIGQWDLSQARMREIPFLVPSPSEQTAIVSFLDHADRRIRRYIRAKQKLIALLEEQKKAIIHQTVTGQIDVRTGQPYPAYKPSSVEWLEEVPAHWEVRKLKHEMSFRGGGTPSKANPSYWKGDIPWVSPKDMKVDTITDSEDHITEAAVVESSTSLVPAGSILMVVRSGILQRTIPVALCGREVALNQDMKALTATGRTTPTYFLLLVRGCEDRLLTEWRKQGATVESIEHQFLADTSIPVPPLDEQSMMERFVAKETKPIGLAVNGARDKIGLMIEYRTRLIADVVTGKLDVREAAAALPEVDPLAAEDPIEDTLDPGGEPDFDEPNGTVEEAQA